MTNDKGESKTEFKCDIRIIAETLPRLIGSVDGCQKATNETRNRVLEYAEAATEAIGTIPRFIQGVVLSQKDKYRGIE